MKKATQLLCAALLCAGTGGCDSNSASPERQWAAYREMHDSFSQFQRDQSEQRFASLRLRLMVWPQQPNLPLDGLSLSLAGATTRQRLAVHPLSGVDLPQLPQAYAEDAVLQLDQPRGRYRFSLQYSIQARADGRYSRQWLEEACAQCLAKKREFGLSHRLSAWGKHCAGVVFKFRRPDGGAPLAYEDAHVGVTPLQAQATPFFGDDAEHRIGVVQIKFRDWPQGAQLLARQPPDVIDFALE